MKIFISLLLTFFSIQPSISFSETGENIWKKLKNGGLVVLMRHTSTTKEGSPLVRDPSCLKETQLSAKGKKEAARAGELFTTKGIPVNKVLTSPYCRTTDTAKIAFSQGQPAEFLTLLETLPLDQAEVNTEQLKHEISSYSGNGNLVLITHAPNINAVSFEIVEMGEFLVLQPLGEDEFDEIGKINLAY